MSTQTLDSEIVNSLSLLNGDEKASILSVIKSFLNLKGQTQVERITIDQYNKELDEAIERINEGRFFTQQQLEEQSAKW